jgi:hypothetical protein
VSDRLSAVSQERSCRVCGCTDRNSCPFGCFWAYFSDPSTGEITWVEPDLCSVCDAFIEAFAGDIEEFNLLSAAGADGKRFASALMGALIEAWQRLQDDQALSREPLVVAGPLIYVARD